MSDSAEERIFAVFARKHPDGTNVYTTADVHHYLPLYIITAGISSELLDETSLGLFARFIDAVRAETDGEVTLESIFAYYARHPANPGLVEEMRRVMFELATETQVDTRANFSRLLASANATFEARKAPSEGQVRAGPLARFAIDKKK
jgi:hypothetical protein